MKTKKRSVIKQNILLYAMILLFSTPLFSQDLEPRRWTVLPAGMNVIGIGYGYTSGDLFLDPLLEIEDAAVEMHTIGFSYVRSFELHGKVLRFDVLIPWHSAYWDGLLSGEPATAKREGFSDPRLRLSINLLNLSEIDENGQKNATVIGAGLAVKVPLGKYYEDKLLNLGENRYTIRPQIGIVHTRGSWSYELTASVFFYTDNDDFYNGNLREQAPLYTMQAHFVYLFNPGFWASLSAGYGIGGQSSYNGVEKDDAWGNFMAAASVGVALTETQGLKFTYLRAQTQRVVGADTQTLGMAWSIRF